MRQVDNEWALSQDDVVCFMACPIEESVQMIEVTTKLLIGPHTMTIDSLEAALKKGYGGGMELNAMRPILRKAADSSGIISERELIRELSRHLLL